MVKNKGFTLIEIIGVITILGIIVILSIPVIDNTMKENRQKLFFVQIDNMKDGLKSWAADHTDMLPDDGGTITLTLGQLKKDNYINREIENPRTKKKFSNSILLTITNINNNYIYDVDMETLSDSDDNNYNENSPSIVLNGESVVRLNINDTYVDKGVMVTLSNGTTGIATTTITKNGATVANINTAIMGNYTITYTTVDGDYTTTLTRLVVVEDKTSPVLIVPMDTAVLIEEVGTFDLMAGVSVSDNSGETITPTSSGSISVLPGKYAIIYTASDSSGNTVTKKRIVTVGNRPAYVDNSGANYPELYTNMIPVKYNGSNWEYADLSEKWYDYLNKEWANAVILKDDVIKNVGDTINVTSDINGMFVWIPRYKYTIFNGNDGIVPEKIINVMFENNLTTTGTVRCIDNITNSGTISETCTDDINKSVMNDISTYTHPAFTFGGTSLRGFWMGKFENSASSPTSDTVQSINIKPNQTSWVNAKIDTFYYSIAKFTRDNNMNNATSHLIKNSEWGAVAYLKQSKYGLGLTAVQLNGYVNSSTYKTGCGPLVDGTMNTGNTCNGYETSLGQKASTTGNIYGIYDMSGGAWDRVMANMVDATTNFNNNGANFTSALEGKYYNSYTYGTGYSSERSKLGEATKEVLKDFNTTNNAWYNNYTLFPGGSYAWLMRGGLANNSGIFSYAYCNGGVNSTGASRTVLVKK